LTKYFNLNLKLLLTNPSLIFWAIIFIEYWVFMWAYVFSAGLPPIEEAVKNYVSLAYGSLVVISLSAAATSICYELIYSSKSIKFVTKYTKLSPSRFLAENFASCFIVLLFVSAVLFISLIGLSCYKFGILVLPENALGLVAISLLSAIFLYALSAFLSLLLVVLRAPKSASFLSFIPLIMSFLAYGSLWTDFKILAYVSPFNCIMALCYHFFSGRQPVTGAFLMSNGENLMSVSLSAVSLIAWTLALLILVVVLLRKMKGVGIEEIRLV